MNRARRRPIAWIALLAVAFLQLATAAHACDLVAGRSAPSSLAAEVAAPCEDMGMPTSPTRSGVCLEHCKSDSQLFDHHAPVAVADCAAVLATVQWLPSDTCAVTTRSALVVPRAAAPPIFASSGRLRI
jgi:hypothetical protein